MQILCMCSFSSTTLKQWICDMLKDEMKNSFCLHGAFYNANMQLLKSKAVRFQKKGTTRIENPRNVIS